MSTFKALRVHQVENSFEARLEQIQLSDLNAGEVAIRIAYFCLNYKDALAVTGKTRIMCSMPRVAGIDLSGVVEGSADPRYKPGDKVLVTGCGIGELLDGRFAEFARVPAEAVVALPRGAEPVRGDGVGTACFAAAVALHRMLENHQVPEHGPIAFTGPTGGVGSVAISLFKRQGFKVTAITGKATPESKKCLRLLGADEIVDRNSLDLGSKRLEVVSWGGAVDNLGGGTLAYLARTVKPWGNIGSVGLAQAYTLNTTMMPFISRGVSQHGIHLRTCRALGDCRSGSGSRLTGNRTSFRTSPTAPWR